MYNPTIKRKYSRQSELQKSKVSIKLRNKFEESFLVCVKFLNVM